jgi:hypothetical protein
MIRSGKGVNKLEGNEYGGGWKDDKMQWVLRLRKGAARRPTTGAQFLLPSGPGLHGIGTCTKPNGGRIRFAGHPCSTVLLQVGDSRPNPPLIYLYRRLARR